MVLFIYIFFHLFICGGAQVEVGTISLVTTFHLHLVVPSTTWVSTAVVSQDGGVVFECIVIFVLTVNVYHIRHSSWVSLDLKVFFRLHLL